MAVDTSNLVNMLATQPGQNMANLGATLLGAQESVRQREADAARAAIEQRKAQLAEAVAAQQMTLGDIEIAGKRGEMLSSLSQTMLEAKDPIVKQQILAAQAPILKKVGVSDDQIRMGIENVNNPEFWKGIQAIGVGASEYWKQLNEQREAKAPTTRNIREGKDIVAQEWVPATKQWIEVGRGPVGKGSITNISLGKEADIWGKVFDRYEKSMQPIVEQRAEVERIKTAVNTPGGASAQALQSSIANLFGGQTRAVAELERWATFGNLPDRVVNSATKFLTGEYSDQGKADVLKLLRNWETQYLNKEHEQINERFEKVAGSSKVPTEFFMRDIPEVRNLDFSAMGIEEILNLDTTTLELDEQKALEDRLTELGY